MKVIQNQMKVIQNQLKVIQNQMKVIQKHVMRTVLYIHVSLHYFRNIKRKK
jgi:hypothetical protein